MFLVARTREKLDEVAKEVEERGGTAHVHPADLSDTADIERMANEVVEQHGGVDILVNNAGRSIRRSVKYQSDRFHDFERTMQLNYFGALRLILTFLPGMRERKHGHIINISSYSVQMNTPRFAAYAASKAALDQFSRCIAAEVVDKRIDITTIYMPLVRTPMIAPTDFYKALPAAEPEEAGQLVTDAMIDKPKRGQAAGDDRAGHLQPQPEGRRPDHAQVYRLFPEKDPKKKEEERRAREDGGEPAKDDEISSEATALAYPDARRLLLTERVTSRRAGAGTRPRASRGRARTPASSPAPGASAFFGSPAVLIRRRAIAIAMFSSPWK